MPKRMRGWKKDEHVIDRMRERKRKEKSYKENESAE